MSLKAFMGTSSLFHPFMFDGKLVLGKYYLNRKKIDSDRASVSRKLITNCKMKLFCSCPIHGTIQSLINQVTTNRKRIPLKATWDKVLRIYPKICLIGKTVRLKFLRYFDMVPSFASLASKLIGLIVLTGNHLPGNNLIQITLEIIPQLHPQIFIASQENYFLP